MVRVLGSNRLLFIVALALALGCIVSGYYYWLVPFSEKISNDLQTTKAAVDDKYQQVARMKEEYVLLQSQLRSFKELEAKGFFNDQDRSPAIDKLDKLSGYAGLLKASLKFGRGQMINDPVAEQAGQVVLKSPVTISISSIDDVDIYSFIKFIEEKFPGSIDVTYLNLKRTEIFNPAILRKIGSGDISALVNAELQFDWFTMASKDIVAPAGSDHDIANGVK